MKRSILAATTLTALTITLLLPPPSGAANGGGNECIQEDPCPSDSEWDEKECKCVPCPVTKTTIISKHNQVGQPLFEGPTLATQGPIPLPCTTSKGTAGYELWEKHKRKAKVTYEKVTVRLELGAPCNRSIEVTYSNYTVEEERWEWVQKSLCIEGAVA